jgi:hypothetical protein
MNRHNDLGRWLVSLLSSLILSMVFPIDESAHRAAKILETIVHVSLSGRYLGRFLSTANAARAAPAI